MYTEEWVDKTIITTSSGLYRVKELVNDNTQILEHFCKYWSKFNEPDLDNTQKSKPYCTSLQHIVASYKIKAAGWWQLFRGRKKYYVIENLFNGKKGKTKKTSLWQFVGSQWYLRDRLIHVGSHRLTFAHAPRLHHSSPLVVLSPVHLRRWQTTSNTRKWYQLVSPWAER